MAQLVTYELTTATVNVSMLGLPKATGNVAFTVDAYLGDNPKLVVEGTDIRLGKGTSYTVMTTAVWLPELLAEPPNVGRYRFETFSTVNCRAATQQVQERLLDVGHAALTALVQDPGFATWIIGAHVEQVRSELIPLTTRQIDRMKKDLTDTERELQQCQDIVDAAGPLTNEQLKVALTLTKSKHSLGTAIEAARKI